MQMKNNGRLQLYEIEVFQPFFQIDCQNYRVLHLWRK